MRLLCATFVNNVGLHQKPFPGNEQLLWYISAPSFFPMLRYFSIVSNCARELIAPISVFLSSGSPTINDSMRSRSFLMTSFATDSCTYNLEPAQHTWPWLK